MKPHTLSYVCCDDFLIILLHLVALREVSPEDAICCYKIIQAVECAGNR